MTYYCGRCGTKLKKLPGTGMFDRRQCPKCHQGYSKQVRASKGPIEGTMLEALGVDAIKFGPVYVDHANGRFFISIDLGMMGGLKLRLSPEGWSCELPHTHFQGKWQQKG